MAHLFAWLQGIAAIVQRHACVVILCSGPLQSISQGPHALSAGAQLYKLGWGPVEPAPDVVGDCCNCIDDGLGE